MFVGVERESRGYAQRNPDPIVLVRTRIRVDYIDADPAI